LLNGDGHGDRLMSTNTNRKSLKLELLHDESEISDQTKDLQKNLMRQVHEDVINKPDMLANDKTIMSDSSETNSSWLNHGISELIEVIIIISTLYGKMYLNNILDRKNICQN